MIGGGRKTNFFEKVLLVVGVIVGIVGFHFINIILSSNKTEMWGLVQSVFLWLILIVLIVLLATEEDVKEELGIIMKAEMEEVKLMKEEVALLKEDTRLLKQIAKEQLEEIKLIRTELVHTKYKD